MMADTVLVECAWERWWVLRKVYYDMVCTKGI